MAYGEDQADDLPGASHVLTVLLYLGALRVDLPGPSPLFLAIMNLRLQQAARWVERRHGRHKPLYLLLAVVVVDGGANELVDSTVLQVVVPVHQGLQRHPLLPGPNLCDAEALLRDAEGRTRLHAR